MKAGQAGVSQQSLWEKLEPLLTAVERPSRYLNHEYNAKTPAFHDGSGQTPAPAASDYRVALLYPDTYELGQANQAITILYSIINALDGCVAERVFLPWVDL
ncbi:MAG: hypothetical protein LBP24_00270, partial [Coriobacteriales bacterium]|nr:hypothetical protein [Coriobacteriales bacterium]